MLFCEPRNIINYSSIFDNNNQWPKKDTIGGVSPTFSSQNRSSFLNFNNSTVSHLFWVVLQLPIDIFRRDNIEDSTNKFVTEKKIADFFFANFFYIIEFLKICFVSKFLSANVDPQLADYLFFNIFYLFLLTFFKFNLG